MMPTMDINDKVQNEVDMEAQLAAYRQKVATEFSLANLGEDAHDPVKVTEKIRMELLENVGHAIASITELARDGKSESIRLQASKFVVERLLGNSTIDGTASAMDQFLKTLHAPGGSGVAGHSDHE